MTKGGIQIKPWNKGWSWDINVRVIIHWQIIVKNSLIIVLKAFFFLTFYV